MAAASVASALTGCGARSASEAHRAVDPRTGVALVLPRGWRLIDDRPNGPSAMMLVTYPIRRLGDISEEPPAGESWMMLWDGGPLWALPSWSHRLRPLPSRLPRATSLEGFGEARMVDFRAAGHQFTAYIKGEPTAVLAILRTIRLTPFGRSLALAITSRTVDGVRVWRVGNPRGRRRLIVIGCPGRAKGCSGFAVTDRLVNGVEPVATDLWVIQQLRGRDGLLARLQQRLQPEATISLGAVRDPDVWTSRIVALAR
jgi:hypothetical protein